MTYYLLANDSRCTDVADYLSYRFRRSLCLYS
jgi:hypothetical protein